MNLLSRLSSSMGRRDELPNQELAKDLAGEKNPELVKEVASLLSHSEKKIQYDCLKVLYEIGYICPELIAPYTHEFFRLLKSRHNRLVWGAMIALSTIAPLKPQEINAQADNIINTIKQGSVITVDSGIKTLSLAAAANKACKKSIFPYLIRHLLNCRPKEIPMHAEFIFEAVDVSNKQEYIDVLNKRKHVLTPSQLKRVEKLLKKAGE